MSNRKSAQRSQNDSGGFKLKHELTGLLNIFLGLLLILSLSTFDSRDPWLNHVVSGSIQVHNKAGLFGSYIAGLLLDLIGCAAWAIAGFFCFLGIRKILAADSWQWWRWNGLFFLIVALSFVGAYFDSKALQQSIPVASSVVASHGGGLLGHALYSMLVGWLSPVGAWLMWTLCLLFAFQMLLGFSWIGLLPRVSDFFVKTGIKMAGDLMEAGKTKINTTSDHDTRAPFHMDIAPNKEQGYELNYEQKVSSVEEQPLLVQSFPLGENIELQQTSNFYKEDVFASLEKQPSDDRLSVPDYLPEKNLPPWVLDFEAGLHGVHEGEEGAHTTSQAPASQVSRQIHTAQVPIAQAQGLQLAEYENEEQAQHESKQQRQYKNEQQGHDETTFSSSVTLREEQQFPSTPANVSTITSVDALLVEQYASPIAGASSQESGLSQKNISFSPTDIKAETPQKKDMPNLFPHKKTAQPSLPPLGLLTAISNVEGKTPPSVLDAKGKALVTCLTDFGIQCELVGVTPGPVVTMFEIRPAPGVRVARIANLSDDLALALKAVAVRIQAPIPGTDTVGVEIPNEKREVVCLRGLLASDTFTTSKSLLTLVLGKDIAGNPAMADLAAMPHLLVAGATGAGKSVGINSIILSLLYKAKPEEVKLLLIDPKRVEMAIYADLPHLVHPVVTDMQLAKNALDWAVKEMEGRYSSIAKAGVRNIGDYNAKLKELGDKRPEGMEDLEFMPYLVIIIDELADLMLTAAKEVETSIVRLAQLARAAGIHLILATQRPSVDVVTGIIKANFPCRIAYQVTSKHDSRTILDTVGAEHLLGRGDMLFKPAGGRFQRMHGAFVDDKNVRAVVDFWKMQQQPNYSIDFSEWGVPEEFGNHGAGSDEILSDPIYNEAVSFVRQQDKASISLIQRRFRIGFNKAARIVEQMEQDGIIGPQEGSKPRTVL